MRCWEEPHALLGVRQWHGLAAIDTGDRPLQVASACGLDARDLGAERTQLAGLEQALERQLDIAGLAAARDDLGSQQRMAAEGEKVVLQTDLRQIQHFAPDRRHLPLQCAVRLDVPRRSILPLGPSGICARWINWAGTMYAGRC